MDCKICNRESEESGFCQFHLKAYNNIIEKFKFWEASSDVSWGEYLVEIQKNSLTGEWAKEVAKCLIEEETEDDK